MGKPIDKQYLIDNMRTFKSVILDPSYIIQRQVLPQATAENVGVIYQYIGSSVSLTKGGFYECQLVAGSDPAEYEWIEISTKTLTDGVTILTNTDKELYVPDASTLTKGVVKIGDGLAIDASTGATKVINRLEEIDELPTAAAALEGKIYLLTAAQTGYDRGGIYMCEESTETTGTYEWKLISTSPLEAGKGITIENNVISADTNVFTGTMDEWDALTPAEQAEYDFIATPDEAVEDIADAIIDGDMRAITSNAVAQVVPSNASSSNKLVTVSDIIVKKGTWEGSLTLYPMGDSQVRDRFNIPITFDSPMPDYNYTVIIEFFESRYVTIRAASKTASGFHIEGANADNNANSQLTRITWTAIRFPS